MRFCAWWLSVCCGIAFGVRRLFLQTRKEPRPKLKVSKARGSRKDPQFYDPDTREKSQRLYLNNSHVGALSPLNLGLGHIYSMVRNPIKGYYMGGCQNFGPLLGTLNNRCRVIIGTQKGILILTTTYIGLSTLRIFEQEIRSELGILKLGCPKSQQPALREDTSRSVGFMGFYYQGPSQAF